MEGAGLPADCENLLRTKLISLHNNILQMLNNFAPDKFFAESKQMFKQLMKSYGNEYIKNSIDSCKIYYILLLANFNNRDLDLTFTNKHIIGSLYVWKNVYMFGKIALKLSVKYLETK